SRYRRRRPGWPPPHSPLPDASRRLPASSGFPQCQVRRFLRALQGAAAPGEAGIRHEVGVRAEGFRPGTQTGIASIGFECPALHVVLQVRDHDLVEDLLMHGRVLDRYQAFDAVVAVALHPVRRGDEHLGAARGQPRAGAEADDAGMLEEAADDALDADVVGKPGYARPQAADAAHDEIDLDTGLRGAVEG